MSVSMNYMESIVIEIYEDVVKNYSNFCNCSICREDVICMALNELPPLYNTSTIGKTYGKLLELQPQFRVQVVQVLGKAIEKVHTNPRH